jgi:16S rRNA (guanine527-N7)-methyltransferase
MGLILLVTMLAVMEIKCHGYNFNLFKLTMGIGRLAMRCHSTSVVSAGLEDKLRSYTASFPTLTGAQVDKLLNLCYKTIEWNKKVNLISRKDIDFLLENHLLPSLAVSKVRTFDAGDKAIDVGTGGGFPGLPLSIAFPSVSFTLIDGNIKKMKVVQDIVDSLGLTNVRVLASRAEHHHEHYDYILGRAVTAIPSFLSFTSHLQKSIDATSPNSAAGMLYIKGGNFLEELTEAKISSYTLTPVKELVPIEIEKFVLAIPATEVIAFHGRLKASKPKSKPETKLWKRKVPQNKGTLA